MPARTPLVLNAGEIQQLQPGDTLNATLTSPPGLSVSLTMSGSGSVPGNAVAYSGNDSASLAIANSATASRVVGLSVGTIGVGTAGLIQFGGVLVLTTAQWDAVAGTTGGLAFGVAYYLDPATAGKLTATAPTTVGQYVVLIGRAISSTELNLVVEPRILL